MVSAQAAGEPDRHTAHQAERGSSLQPQERSRLPVQGILPALLGLRLAHLGGKIPGPVVRRGDALAHRPAEEICPHRTQPPRTAAELFPGPQAILQRCRRGPEQQSQSHYEKSVRLSNLQGHRTGLVSCTWQATRAKARPQFLLTNQKFNGAERLGNAGIGIGPAARGQLAVLAFGSHERYFYRVTPQYGSAQRKRQGPALCTGLIVSCGSAHNVSG